MLLDELPVQARCKILDHGQATRLNFDRDDTTNDCEQLALRQVVRAQPILHDSFRSKVALVDAPANLLVRLKFLLVSIVLGAVEVRFSVPQLTRPVSIKPLPVTGPHA